MKRIHLTTKPPKIKRTVFDGASSKFQTKHVRMTYNGSDVSNSNNTNQEVTNQLAQIDYPADQFDFQCEDNVNSNPGRINLTYAEKRKRVMGAWDLLRDKLIETRLEEQSPATHCCCFCESSVDDVIFCQDCGPSAYYCDTCCKRIHQNILFHKPHQWKQTMYVPIQMTNELARKDHICESSYSTSIYAVDVKGLQHTCKIQLCRCEDPAVTFLRYSLWPATPTSPKIGFDLRFMELLSVLQLECCLPAKSFCDALDTMHSNYIKLISNVEKNIYRAVVGDCLTEYNYHRYSLNTRANITESSFATECPICVKTPSIVSMDANFGLVHKQSSGSGQDRQSARHKNLYFLDHGDLRRFIDDYALDSKAPNSECSNFQAGNAIRSKVKNGKLDVTGIFGSVCKHDIPIYFADLVHGERLSYPVYMLKCILENRSSDNLVVMYDIACMLHKHLKKTNNIDVLERCSFAVPVFHSFAHNTECQLMYGQRFADGTGLTDGEGIERLWSYLRGFRKITKEMTINNRQDLLTEAMLHHTEKQIWNLGKKMLEKKKRCVQILKENEAIISGILVDMKESKDVIQTWKEEWKTQSNRKERKALPLTTDEQYAELLHQIESKKQLLDINEADDEKVEMERRIERLISDCSKLKKKTNLTQLQLTSDQGQLLLESAQTKRKSACLVKLKELATDRQYLSSLMKKYAEGQAIGIRISKQFSSNFLKIKKEVDKLNAINNTNLDSKQFLSLESEIYDQLESRKISENQQKAVQSKCLIDHAEEESNNIDIEIKKYLLYLSKQSKEIIDTINNLLPLEGNRFHLGKINYLFVKHFNIETLFHSCFTLFEHTVTDVSIVPRIVHDKLNTELSRSLNLPTEEEMTTIFQEIEQFETNDLNSIYIEKDSDEELDEDDI
ncbi:uncharacterized protein [Mytilus edulis]|uniref:uncharacterized protein n=1 Tax=Mytilus edulis TaxID=6550 RepID=UPI0039EEA43B